MVRRGVDPVLQVNIEGIRIRGTGVSQVDLPRHRVARIGGRRAAVAHGDRQFRFHNGQVGGIITDRAATPGEIGIVVQHIPTIVRCDVQHDGAVGDGDRFIDG